MIKWSHWKRSWCTIDYVEKDFNVKMSKVNNPFKGVIDDSSEVTRSLHRGETVLRRSRPVACHPELDFWLLTFLSAPQSSLVALQLCPILRQSFPIYLTNQIPYYFKIPRLKYTIFQNIYYFLDIKNWVNNFRSKEFILLFWALKKQI